MSEPNEKRLPHYLVGATRQLWRDLQRLYGPSEPPHWKRSALIRSGIWSQLPERIWESWRYRRVIAATELHPAPVFIVGYWQSGHSLMHHLMANDPQFATTSLLHCALPNAWITLEPLVRWIIRRRGHKTRHVDAMPMSADGPQGDDLAMAGLTDLSIYHGYSFPKSYEAIFRRSVLFEGVSSDTAQEWQHRYRHLLQKVAWHTGRSRLLSRNAAHSGRIRWLLEMFPQAKFIHLHRNPYRVYAAQAPKWRSLCGLWALQTPNIEQLVNDTVRLYPALMQRLLSDRERLPANQWIDVRYDELSANPTGVLRQVYDQLELPGFDPLAEHLAKLGESAVFQLAGHDVSLTPEQEQSVSREWGFAFEQLGYPLDPALAEQKPQHESAPERAN